MNAIEPLESRIAPATLTGHILQYTDLDGESIRVTINTNGALTAANFTFDTAFDSTGPQRLQLIDLRSSVSRDYDGASISAQVSGSGGDGEVTIERIDATGNDLRTVTIPGGLDQLLCGDNDAALALKKLSVTTFGVTTPSNGMPSVISGSVGSFTVSDVLKNVGVFIAGNAETIDVGGLLAASDLAETGFIKVTGGVKKLHVGGDGIHGGDVGISGVDILGALTTGVVDGGIFGGGGFESALFFANSVGKLTIMGDVQGGAGESSALVSFNGNAKSIQVGGSIVGGTSPSATNSGQIFVGGKLKSINVDGSVIGGAGTFSGYIDSEGALGRVHIAGNLTGGSGQESGVIFSDSKMKNIEIVGNLVAGNGQQAGYIDCNSSIKKVTIGGDMTGTAGHPAWIVAPGPMAGGVAIKKVSIGGDATFANIWAGYDDLAVESDGASIGTVKVIGNVVATNIVASVRDLNGNGFGDDGDNLVPAARIPTIAKIIIGGTVDGTLVDDGFYGFTAGLIKKISINGSAVPLTAAKDDIAVPGSTTNDYRIHEIQALI